jgi:hypothetical protein
LVFFAHSNTIHELTLPILQLSHPIRKVFADHNSQVLVHLELLTVIPHEGRLQYELHPIQMAVEYTPTFDLPPVPLLHSLDFQSIPFLYFLLSSSIFVKTLHHHLPIPLNPNYFE